MEPVTLDFVKAHARITTDVEDGLLAVYITAARQQAEQWCNRFFVSQVATKTFRINQLFDLPRASVTAVSGFYTNVAAIPEGYDYFSEYAKGISVNRQYPIDGDNMPTYTVTYQVTIVPEDVPAAVKVAIAKCAAELYENRESGGAQELGITYKTLLAPYRVI